jgi:hypothetical protein
MNVQIFNEKTTTYQIKISSKNMLTRAVDKNSILISNLIGRITDRTR